MNTVIATLFSASSAVTRDEPHTTISETEEIPCDLGSSSSGQCIVA
jgi:hypothetical protein